MGRSGRPLRSPSRLGRSFSSRRDDADRGFGDRLTPPLEGVALEDLPLEGLPLLGLPPVDREPSLRFERSSRFAPVLRPRGVEPLERGVPDGFLGREEGRSATSEV